MTDKEIKEALEWALKQTITEYDEKIEVKNNRHLIVDFVRKYFNDNDVDYSMFSYKDLEPFV